ncbi:MAG: thioredoxin, partial [Burkholderiales bacterium]|nr:thioredoxin [Burkholderiales bacterium]
MTSPYADLCRATKAISVGLAACLFSLAASAETALPPARDLAADAVAAARSGMPLIVMISLPGCPHCEVVRRSHLLPLLRAGNATHSSLIRQVEINGQEKLRDFSGRSITHADFASNYKIKVAPVVMFFGVGGEQLAAPLVGAMIPDFYGAYFDAALAEAKS